MEDTRRRLAEALAQYDTPERDQVMEEAGALARARRQATAEDAARGSAVHATLTQDGDDEDDDMADAHPPAAPAQPSWALRGAALDFARSRGLDAMRRALVVTGPPRSFEAAACRRDLDLAAVIGTTRCCCVILDAETPGLADNASMLEVAAFSYTDRGGGFVGYGLPRPQERITAEAERLHHISLDELQRIGAPPQRELLSNLLAFLADAAGDNVLVVIAHGHMDFTWIRNGLEASGLDAGVLTGAIAFDTLEAALNILRGRGLDQATCTVGDLSKDATGRVFVDAHSAAPDAVAAASLFAYLWDMSGRPPLPAFLRERGRYLFSPAERDAMARRAASLGAAGDARAGGAAVAAPAPASDRARGATRGVRGARHRTGDGLGAPPRDAPRAPPRSAPPRRAPPRRARCANATMDAAGAQRLPEEPGATARGAAMVHEQRGPRPAARAAPTARGPQAPPPGHATAALAPAAPRDGTFGTAPPRRGPPRGGARASRSAQNTSPPSGSAMRDATPGSSSDASDSDEEVAEVRGLFAGMSAGDQEWYFAEIAQGREVSISAFLDRAIVFENKPVPRAHPYKASSAWARLCAEVAHRKATKQARSIASYEGKVVTGRPTLFQVGFSLRLPRDRGSNAECKTRCLAKIAEFNDKNKWDVNETMPACLDYGDPRTRKLMTEFYDFHSDLEGGKGCRPWLRKQRCSWSTMLVGVRSCLPQIDDRWLDRWDVRCKLAAEASRERPDDGQCEFCATIVRCAEAAQGKRARAASQATSTFTGASYVVWEDGAEPEELRLPVVGAVVNGLVADHIKGTPCLDLYTCTKCNIHYTHYRDTSSHISAVFRRAADGSWIRADRVSVTLG